MKMVKLIPVNPVGQKIDEASYKILLKVIDFTSQVWINCEEQVDMYQFPCGTLFANVARKVREIKNCIEFWFPCSLLFTLGLEFAKYADNNFFGDIASIMTLIFIHWAAFIEVRCKSGVTFKLCVDGLSDSLSYVENIQNCDMLQCLKYGHLQLTNAKINCNSDILKCLQAAASSSEKNANENIVQGKKIAGSHVVGITLRGIFQAVKVTL